MAWDFETDPEYQAARAKHAEYLEHEVGNQ
jgi:hypothetical protein